MHPLTVESLKRSPLDRSPRGVSTSETMELVAVICEATAKHLRHEGMPGSAHLLKAEDPTGLTPLHSYVDVVIVNGVEYRIDIRPHVSEYPSCAEAEIKLGGDLLRWEEKADRWEGYHKTRNVRVAVVKKK